MNNDLKRKIKTSSLALFDKYSYSKTSVSDIANAVGINKATIYEHFRSKEEIIVEILKDRFESIKETEADFYFSKDIDFELKLDRYISKILEEFTNIQYLLFGTFDNIIGNVIKEVFTKFDSYKDLATSFILEVIKSNVIKYNKSEDILKDDIGEFFYLIIGRIMLHFFKHEWNDVENLKNILTSVSNNMFKAIVLK